jgi:hypothetical protein
MVYDIGLASDLFHNGPNLCPCSALEIPVFVRYRSDKTTILFSGA